MLYHNCVLENRDSRHRGERFFVQNDTLNKQTKHKRQEKTSVIPDTGVLVPPSSGPGSPVCELGFRGFLIIIIIIIDMLITIIIITITTISITTITMFIMIIEQRAANRGLATRSVSPRNYPGTYACPWLFGRRGRLRDLRCGHASDVSVLLALRPTATCCRWPLVQVACRSRPQDLR